MACLHTAKMKLFEHKAFFANLWGGGGSTKIGTQRVHVSAKKLDSHFVFP